LGAGVYNDKRSEQEFNPEEKKKKKVKNTFGSFKKLLIFAPR